MQGSTLHDAVSDPHGDGVAVRRRVFNRPCDHNAVIYMWQDNMSVQ